MSPLITFLIILLAGMLPAIVWLLFWLKEDRLHPEPRRLVLLAFLLGMGAVPLVIPIQKLTQDALGIGFLLLIVWATIEEVVKFIAAYTAGLRTAADDEPIDAVIYLVTAALGFAALENMLFLLSPIAAGELLGSIVAGNIRFVGATVLHTVASGAIGVSIALSFYGSRMRKIVYRTIGFGTAILLHTIFNLFILQTAVRGLIGTLLFVWVMVIIMILFLEKIKRVTRAHEKRQDTYQ